MQLPELVLVVSPVAVVCVRTSSTGLLCLGSFSYEYNSRACSKSACRPARLLVRGWEGGGGGGGGVGSALR